MYMYMYVTTLETLCCGQFWELGEVSCIEGCSHYRGKFIRKHNIIWDTCSKVSIIEGVLILGVSFKRGSTVLI